MNEVNVIGVQPQTQLSHATPPRKRPWPRRNRRGFGLGGAVLAIVIGAIILSATFAIFNQTNTNFRTQETMTRVGLVESELRRSYANAANFDSGTLEDIVRSAMPRNALQGTTGDEDIVTPWGGHITAGAGTTVGTTGTASPNRFWIRIEGLPISACQAIAEAHLNNSGVLNVHAKDTAGGTFAAAITSRANIETNCDGAGDNNQVGIVFRG